MITIAERVGFRQNEPVSDVAETLMQAGMSEGAAQDKALLFRAVERELPHFSRAERFRWFVPGRILLLGKDTDCVGGRSLLCAAERGYCVAAAPRSDMLVRITDVVKGQTLTLHLSSHQSRLTETAGKSAVKLLSRLSHDFPTLVCGADIVFASDLPSSAGMGGSSAPLIAIFDALFTVNRLHGEESLAHIRSPEKIARYLTRVEMGGRHPAEMQSSSDGASSIGEEYAAILLSRPHQAVQVTSFPGVVEGNIGLPAQCVFAVASTGVDTEEARSRQAGRVTQEISSILDLWRAASRTNPHSLLEALRSSPDTADRFRDALRNVQDSSDQKRRLGRFEQIYMESEVIIPKAVAALAADDLSGFSELVDESQAAWERWLGNQESATAWLARQARSLGAHASSTFGQGSVWALVERVDAEKFSQRWRKSCADMPHSGARLTQFLVTEAGPAVVKG